MFMQVAERLESLLAASNMNLPSSLFERLIRSFALDERTDLREPLCDLIGLVLKHDIPQLEGTYIKVPVKHSSRVRMFFHLLSKTIERGTYTRSADAHFRRMRRFAKEPGPQALAGLNSEQRRVEFVQLNLTLELAGAAFALNDPLGNTKRQLDKFAKSRRFTQDSGEPLADQILEDREKIANMDSEQPFPFLVREGRKASGSSGMGNFCPLEQKNVPNYVARKVLVYSTRTLLKLYSNQSGSGSTTPTRHVIHRLRIPSPTRDPNEVMGAFRLFLDYCYANRLILRYTNLQSPNGVEGGRWKAIRALADHHRYKKCFVMLGLSMDKSRFPEEGTEAIGWEACTNQLRAELQQAETDTSFQSDQRVESGYYFPLRQIKELFRKRHGAKLRFDRVLDQAIHAARMQLDPAVRAGTLSVAQQRVFRQTVFSKIESILDVLLGVHFINDACKDNQDRGPTQAMLDTFHCMVEAGVDTDSETRLNFRAALHGPALFNKGVPILLSDDFGAPRGQIVIDAIRQKQPTREVLRQMQGLLGFRTEAIYFGLKQPAPSRVRPQLAGEEAGTASPRSTKRHKAADAVA